MKSQLAVIYNVNEEDEISAEGFRIYDVPLISKSVDNIDGLPALEAGFKDFWTYDVAPISSRDEGTKLLVLTNIRSVGETTDRQTVLALTLPAPTTDAE